MGIREFPPMTEREALTLNSLQLAHIGDTVWEMLIRTRLSFEKCSIRHMHLRAVDGVNAHAQAIALKALEDTLTETEADIVRRGRNTHPKHPVPKHQDPADYAAATGLEALMGFLYLTGQDERILTLFQISREDKSCQP